LIRTTSRFPACASCGEEGLDFRVGLNRLALQLLYQPISARAVISLDAARPVASSSELRESPTGGTSNQMVNSSICVRCSSSVGNALYPSGLKKHLYFRATPAAIGPQYFREAAQVINGAAGGPPGRGGPTSELRRGLLVASRSARTWG
jgi:hypothetical protein